MYVRILNAAVVLLSLTLIMTGCIQQTTLSPAEIDARSSDSRMDIMCLVSAVINDYEIDWTKVHGVREAGSNEPLTTDTLFQAASIGKPLTAVA